VSVSTDGTDLAGGMTVRSWVTGDFSTAGGTHAVRWSAVANTGQQQVSS